MVFGRYQPVSPPPTKRIKHEQFAVDNSGRGPGRSGRVKPEAALGSARHRDGRTSTPRSVIVISDTEDDADAAATQSVFYVFTFYQFLLHSAMPECNLGIDDTVRLTICLSQASTL